VPVKSKVEILQKFLAFSEYMNLNKIGTFENTFQVFSKLDFLKAWSESKAWSDFAMTQMV
jgi:hypothetical protein